MAVLTALIFAAGFAAGAWLHPAAEPARAAMMAPPVPAARITVMPAAHPADLIRVMDGDTFEARVHVWPGIAVTTRVRLSSIDAPEMKARCPQERVQAEAARDALSAILAEGGITLSQVKIDKYGGRVDAEAATRNTPDVSARLLQAGLARRYHGGRRTPWCL